MRRRDILSHQVHSSNLSQRYPSSISPKAEADRAVSYHASCDTVEASTFKILFFSYQRFEEQTGSGSGRCE